MNKSDLIDEVSRQTALSRRDAEAAVNAFLDGVVNEVRTGQRVSLVGFGTFKQTMRAARMGRNPQTNALVPIPASKGVRFMPSATLKNIVNGKAAPAARKTVKKAVKRATTRKATAKKAPAKRAPAKTTARKAPARKTAAKKTTAKKAPARKAAAKKTTARKTAAKKTTARKTAAKKTGAKKTTARKTAARKTTARKTAAKKTAR